MADIFLSDKQIMERYEISRNTVWRWVRERPDMPRPFKLTPGCTRWRLADLEKWESSKNGVA